MFRTPSQTFDLSDETKEAVHPPEHSPGTSPPYAPKRASFDDINLGDNSTKSKLNSAEVMKHVRECRRLIGQKWADFKPQPPMLVSKRMYDVFEDIWIDEQVMIQLESEPFGHGAIRQCFRMKEVRLETRENCGNTESRNGHGATPKSEASSACTTDACGGCETQGGEGEATPQSETHRMPGLVALASGLIGLKHDERRVLWVAKRAIEGHKDLEAHRRDCESDVMHQMMAKKYAEKFNHAVRERANSTGMGRCGAHDIDFLMTHIIQFEDGQTYGVEAFIFGDYKKHNNNSGATIGARKTPQAFSYFSFIKSGRRHMVVDIQGIGDIYTDPVIHFLPSHATKEHFRHSDSNVNLGIRGFALFLWSHRYNDIDRLLGLPMFKLAPHEQENLPPITAAATVRALGAGGVKQHLSPAGQEESNEKTVQISLTSVPNMDLVPASWEQLIITSPLSPSSKSLPLELVEAACHMEIAAMYNDGRLAKGSKLSRAELESAVFHLAQAARQGLPEASLALARLASDMPHDDFLAEVTPGDVKPELCLALLTCAGAQGCPHAHGAWARLVLARESELDTKRLQEVAKRLELFASQTVTARGEEGDEAFLKHEVSSYHGCCFDWENHGWQPHSALAKAAELFETVLKDNGVPGARDKACELWEAAAESALEDPLLAKQAMRYTQRAEQLQCEEEDVAEQEDEQKEQAKEPTANNDSQQVPVLLSADMASKFLEFAAGFPSPETAMEALLEAARCRSEPEPQQPEVASSKPLKDEPVDDDVWAMLG
eukprot:TRINITY_DN88495_c0_g1_i1.p1 TRINITY_DN88495_c0_g1~~TRINITY_DN88495_c0_g1_i1.p1  ORF type:complete len:776 (-),score=138.87 TRINITY_DN88495_c0_g1_i1:765-3092(-)